MLNAWLFRNRASVTKSGNLDVKFYIVKETAGYVTEYMHQLSLSDTLTCNNALKENSMVQLEKEHARARSASASKGGIQASDLPHSLESVVTWQQRTKTLCKNHAGYVKLVIDAWFENSARW